MGRLVEGIAATTMVTGVLVGSLFMPDLIIDPDNPRAERELEDSSEALSVNQATIVSLADSACAELDLYQTFGAEDLPTDHNKWEDVIVKECPEVDPVEADQSSRIIASYVTDGITFEQQITKAEDKTTIDAEERTAGGAIGFLGSAAILFGGALVVSAVEVLTEKKRQSRTKKKNK